MPVPVGTLVRDLATGANVDLSTPGRKVLVTRGGQGGLGNLHFKSRINKAPRR